MDAAFADAVEAALAPHLPGLWPDAPPGAAAQQAAFCAALAEANQRLNLTGIKTPGDMALRHVADALAALPDADGPGELVDLGSGCGVPGLPLALALPERRVVLVESRQRKAEALAGLVDALGLAPRVEAVRARGEAWLEGRSPCTVVTRAVGSVAAQLRLLAPVREAVGRLVMLKGPGVDEELAEAARLGLHHDWPEPSRRELVLPEDAGTRVVLRYDA